jgi:RNA polymerase sigma-70 factor (ECF subfamily)
MKQVAIPEKNRIPDSEVVERVLSGEKELYELLMRRHNQKLYRVIRGYLRKEQEVEDAMQDTYLKAFEKLRQFRHDALFSTWLIRIGINVALEKIRTNKKFVSGLVLDGTLSEDHLLFPESSYTDPEKITIQKEMKQLLEMAIDNIPETYRMVYILHEVEGMKINEIVQCLDLSESNVKIRLHRAKAMLKDSLYQLSTNGKVFEFGSTRCDRMVEKVMAVITQV